MSIITAPPPTTTAAATAASTVPPQLRESLPSVNLQLSRSILVVQGEQQVQLVRFFGK